MPRPAAKWTLPPIELLTAVGRGRELSSLRLESTPDGYIDLRGLSLHEPDVKARINTPVGAMEVRPDMPRLQRVTLEKVDLTGASLAYTLFDRCVLRDVVFDRANLQDVAFNKGTVEKCRFRGTNLRASVWGFRGRLGPTVLNCDFVDAKMTPSTYGHPMFRNCRFENCKLDEVKFRGSRFEDCVFIGTLSDVWFRQSYEDPNPFVARLKNQMKNVDFSQAELVFVSFLDLDLTQCKLPERGHMKIIRPRRAFQRAIEIVTRDWIGDGKERAIDYLRDMMQYQFRRDVPLYILRPQDLRESQLGPKVADGIIGALEKAMREPNLS